MMIDFFHELMEQALIRECREELASYKKWSKKYADVNKKPAGAKLRMMKLRAWYIYKKAR